MNKGDLVKKADGTKSGGTVKYVCCVNATRVGNGTCDKKTCLCVVRDYAFVAWPASVGGGTSSLPLIELELDTPPETGMVDQMIADGGPTEAKDTSLADKEKELAAQYEQIKKATPYDAEFFANYNYGTRGDDSKPRSRSKTLI